MTLPNELPFDLSFLYQLTQVELLFWSGTLLLVAVLLTWLVTFLGLRRRYRKALKAADHHWRERWERFRRGLITGGSPKRRPTAGKGKGYWQPWRSAFQSFEGGWPSASPIRLLPSTEGGKRKGAKRGALPLGPPLWPPLRFADLLRESGDPARF